MSEVVAFMDTEMVSQGTYRNEGCYICDGELPTHVRFTENIPICMGCWRRWDLQETPPSPVTSSTYHPES